VSGVGAGFFFSSRRRHTRCYRDWSSDVCSSDLVVRSGRKIVGFDLTEVAPAQDGSEWDENVGARILYKLIGWSLASLSPSASARSEERRVGKGGRGWW